MITRKSEIDYEVNQAFLIAFLSSSTRGSNSKYIKILNSQFWAGKRGKVLASI